jgi:predicted AAA+ superfamily ATPase
MSTPVKNYERALVSKLAKRMQEPRHFLQVVTGPRQTGKTTAIHQALSKVALPSRVVSADIVSTSTGQWLESEWHMARSLITKDQPSAVLVIDEIQNVVQWSSYAKKLWDEDALSGVDLRVVISGSSSLLLQKGLSESLMGRFELLRSTHWSLAETQTAFGYSFEDYLVYGGYPASSLLRDDRKRWIDYINDAVIEATLSKDILQLEDIRKPALLRKLFYLGCEFSAQEVSYRKLLGQLDDKGNTETIAHYLDLLASAGLLCGLQKYDEKPLNVRKSSPRLMAFDTSLIAASVYDGVDALLSNSDRRGHLIESAIGANLLARSKQEHFEVFWWRDGGDEVDFVLKSGERVTALEVKSGRNRKAGGILAFKKRFPQAMTLLIGDSNNPIEDFLLGNVDLF